MVGLFVLISSLHTKLSSQYFGNTMTCLIPLNMLILGLLILRRVSSLYIFLVNFNAYADFQKPRVRALLSKYPSC